MFAGFQGVNTSTVLVSSYQREVTDCGVGSCPLPALTGQLKLAPAGHWIQPWAAVTKDSLWLGVKRTVLLLSFSMNLGP